MNLSIIKKSYPKCRILGISEYYKNNQWNIIGTANIEKIDSLINDPEISYIQFKIEDNGVIKFPDFAIEELRKEEA